MPEGLKTWIRDLNARERSGLIVLAGFGAAVLLFTLGTQVGGLVHHVFN